MIFRESNINPLAEFLSSLVEFKEEWIILNSNNLPIMALYFNSGGVVCESLGEVVKVLEVLAEYEVIELKDNKLRITKNGKDALEASKRPLRSLQDLQKNGSQSQAQANKAA
jgi:hypothetical protein